MANVNLEAINEEISKLQKRLELKKNALRELQAFSNECLERHNALAGKQSIYSSNNDWVNSIMKPVSSGAGSTFSFNPQKVNYYKDVYQQALLRLRLTFQGEAILPGYPFYGTEFRYGTDQKGSSDGTWTYLAFMKRKQGQIVKCDYALSDPNWTVHDGFFKAPCMTHAYTGSGATDTIIGMMGDAEGQYMNIPDRRAQIANIEASIAEKQKAINKAMVEAANQANILKIETETKAIDSINNKANVNSIVVVLIASVLGFALYKMLF